MNTVQRILFLLVGLTWSVSAVATPCEGYFPFDGNIDDASGHGNHGLMIAKEGEPQAPQFADGKIGQALHITAGNAMRAFIDLHHEFCPKVTITAWFRLPSADLSGNQYIFSTGRGQGPGLYAAGRRVHMRATSNGIYQRDAIRDADSWWFVAAVYNYDGGETGTYELHWRSRVVEGVMSPDPTPPADAFWIGAYHDGMSYLAQDLYIDEVRIHPTALTRPQIEALAADMSGAGAAVGGAAVAGTGTGTGIAGGQTTGILPAFDPVDRVNALAGTSTLPSCTSHSDCDAGNYCAWDNTCHPENHAPKQALSFQPVPADLASNIILDENARFEDEPEDDPEPKPAPTAEPSGPSGPYGMGNPSFTRVAGSTGGSQRRIDLGEEFLTRIRLRRTGAYADPCRIWANDTQLDLCKNRPDENPESISAELQGSVIGRLSVCAWGTVLGMHVWGDVIDADGSTHYEPASSKVQFSSCAELLASSPDVWTSSMMCGADKLATGIVVHSNDRGTYEAISGLQLICRRIGVR